MRCEKCGVEDPFPFTCSYCGHVFCGDHRLPENHECSKIWLAKPPTKATVEPTGEKLFDTPVYADRYAIQRALWFSKTELKHLAAGALLATLVAVNLTGFFIPNWMTLSLSLLFAASFLLHEMAHKFTAQKSGLWSEFRLTPFGALLTAVSIVSPFKIIAPGAVMVSGVSTISTIGRMALAGPLTNITLGSGLWILSLLVPDPVTQRILFWGADVNGMLAFFNLLPLGVLDGQKVVSWNTRVWAAAITLSIVLILLNRFLF